MAENREYIRQFQYYLYYISLYDPSVPRIVPDGIYGRQTKSAVTEFQRTRGLQPTGDADMATWQAVKDEYDVIMSKFAPPLTMCVFPDNGYTVTVGEKSDVSAVIQIILHCLSGEYGFAAADSISGVYSEKDAEEVKILQRIHGLDQTGTVDIYTWNCICSDYNLFCGMCEYRS